VRVFFLKGICAISISISSALFLCLLWIEDKHMEIMLWKKRLISLLIPILLFLPKGQCFSVLTHEALIDASWNNTLLPLLRKNYPLATDNDLKNAKAYAYGGAVAPDLGYYPFGNTFFSNLVHYVRSGDMTENLLAEAHTLNAYAFALGYLCHYNADIYGHPLATNRSVPLVYPKMEKKFGDEVTYAEDKTSHLRTEFGFDVLQTARGNYASQAYHDFIGFQVDTSLLANAFQKTYGLSLDEVFKHRFSLALETFRWAVKDLIPVITKAAWASKSAQIKKQNASATEQSFSYRMQRSAYEKEFGKNYRHPGLGAWVLSLFVKIFPNIGPFKVLHFRVPNEQAEKYFTESFDVVLSHYEPEVKELANHPEGFVNMDFDTGKPTQKGEYSLCDKSYDQLLLKLQEKGFQELNPELQQNLLRFYSHVSISPNGKISKKQRKFLAALQELKSIARR
jgi:hypothetical protein